MAWDFSTEPEFEAQLEWMRDFVRDEIFPLETSSTTRPGPASTASIAPLKEQVKERGLWAAHLPPELGGAGFGQVKLGLMHEILGRLPFAPVVFGNNAPDSGNAEILALGGTDGAEGAVAAPAAARASCARAFSMTEPGNAGSDPTAARHHARCSTATSGSSTATSGSRSNASVADFLIVMAVTDPDARTYQRASMIIVPADTPGVDIVRDIPHDGAPDRALRHVGGHAEIVYRDVRVPKENLLGARGDGLPARPAAPRARAASTTACAGSACRGGRSTCCASAR